MARRFVPCTLWAFKSALYAALILVAGAQISSKKALAEERAALTRSFPATLAEQRLQTPIGEAKTVESKVIGGKDAARGQFKWQVAVILAKAPASDPHSGFFCGGSLIGWRWVLTAAHCTVPLAADKINVYVGSHDFTGGERLAVTRIVRHEGYNPDTNDNDLALLELAAEPSDKSQAALLSLVAPGDEERLEPGNRATVLGWGSTAQGLLPISLRHAEQVLQYADDLQFKDTPGCNRYHLDDQREQERAWRLRHGESVAGIRAALDARYPADRELITGNMVCAGTNDGSKDACFGDSGGPLIVYRRGEPVQAGIVSWGPGNGCGLTNFYGVYVRLPNYVDWIAGKIH